MPIPLARLDGIPLFRHLGSAALTEISRRGSIRSYPPGTILWRAGDQPLGLHVVLEGRVRITGEVDGRSHVIHAEERGGLLGDVPLFGGGGYPATAIAERRTSCLVLNLDAIAAVVRLDPELAFELLARLAGRVRHLITRLAGITSMSVKSRLATYLLERSRSVDSPSFRLGCSQKALAEELGTVREVVARTLREFRQDGIISPGRTGVWTIEDFDGLRAVARPD